ncbi:S-methyl-5'-thioinosine phosphorylase [Porticoccaceae bacterium LTM1]|nr:S-methyl-5'-thioinosine phosphorylase [Porticoccaceae bacterium LTM1]
MKKLGIIGGTGLADMPELIDVQFKSVATPYGEPSADLVCGVLNGMDVVFLARHGEGHTIPPHYINYRANIAGLMGEGVSHIVAVNAVGGISRNLRPGVMVIPDQLIDYTWGREPSFSDGPEAPLQHIDFTEPYDGQLREALKAAMNACGEPFICGGTMAVTQGPRLETAKEVDRLERDGCDIVGMTGMPEASLARELGLAYASLSLVVNPAAGRCREPITMGDIQQIIDEAMPGVRRVLAELCKCQLSS